MQSKKTRNILWILPFISFIMGYYMVGHVYTVEEINPPNVVGKNIREALGVISQHNINARLLAYKDDALLPEGTVINQMPAASQKMKINQTVYLVLSTKPAQKLAPNFLNKTVQNISDECTKSGTHTKIYTLHNSNYPNNSCFAQFPRPGTTVPDNKVVLYIAQNAQKTVIMPDLRKHTVAQALTFLESYPVRTEIMHNTWQPDEHECSSCVITDQRPLPGTIVVLEQEKPLLVNIMAQNTH